MCTCLVPSVMCLLQKVGIGLAGGRFLCEDMPGAMHDGTRQQDYHEAVGRRQLRGQQICLVPGVICLLLFWHKASCSSLASRLARPAVVTGQV